MAFIEIQRGNDRKRVSSASFENFFKSAGWKVAGENPATSAPVKKEVVKKEQKQVKEEKVEEKNADPVKDEWDEVLKEEEEGIEKPISEMTKKELAKYAEDHNISLAGLTTVSQYRSAIQDFMKEV